ncbi:clavaminate synthase-like; PvcA-like domain [Plesiocystis pacifica SIR-1]|uniref:Clavaminate synthase-like PvcA-like domain n=1 Tax=Plesiocystis pacifica SIR-1 TaxID=391625 RepID=A6G9Y9_9BACT|nr:L-tyrosine/L-tryptophan isonitrile synthase family protein [Plesiocystis pacifica]EDM77314.1 clavaminate synthase-like; PvcA-like domain [Plesiocystis pacifica SIR-1]
MHPSQASAATLDSLRADTRRVVAAMLPHLDALVNTEGVGAGYWRSGRSLLIQALARRVEAGERLPLLLPGFAFKNPNRAKTLGDLPDLAEQLSLQHLARRCAAISTAYREASSGMRLRGAATPTLPWCQLTVFAEGRVWGDLLGVDPEVQRAYARGLRAIPELAPFVEFADLSALARDDPESGIEAEVEVELELDGGWDDPEAFGRLERRLGREPDLARVHARFTRLCMEDSRGPAGADERPAARATRCRVAATRMMVRHAGFTRLLEERYPEHLRLSVHAGSNTGAKLSVHLWPPTSSGERIAGPLPYHGAVLLGVDGGVPRTVRVDEALAAKACVVERTVEGHPWCLRPAKDGERPVQSWP